MFVCWEIRCCGVVGFDLLSLALLGLSGLSLSTQRTRAATYNCLMEEMSRCCCRRLQPTGLVPIA